MAQGRTAKFGGEHPVIPRRRKAKFSRWPFGNLALSVSRRVAWTVRLRAVADGDVLRSKVELLGNLWLFSPPLSRRMLSHRPFPVFGETVPRNQIASASRQASGRPQDARDNDNC